MFFQINITPEAKKAAPIPEEIPEPREILILAPFQPQTRIKIESSPNIPASSTLTIKNTGNRPLDANVTKIPPEERGISLSSLTFSIGPESQAELIISWTPKGVGSWRDTLQLTDSRRVKYDVAITTIATRKGAGKTKSRILGEDNGIRYEKNVSRKSTQHTQNSKIISEPQYNKENLCNNGVPRRSERKHFECTTNPVNNEMSGIFDMSSFQFTPLKNDANENQKKPEPRILSDITFSPHGDIHTPPDTENKPQLRRETFIHPNPQLGIHFSPHESADLTDSDNGPPLRRDTYILNEEVRQLMMKEGSMEEVSDERFDDSLSPQPPDVQVTKSNFSLLMNDMANFMTPVKTEIMTPNACSTGQKSSSNSRHNSTFEIINISEEERTNFNFDRSPVRSTPFSPRHNRLTHNFEKSLPETQSMETFCHESVRNSPSSFRCDNVSVREVLEANLWVNDDEEEKNSSCFRGKGKNLGRIIEERVTSTIYTKTVTTRTFTHKINSSTNNAGFCFEISPTKKIRKPTAVRRISPIKNVRKISPAKVGKITKDKSISQYSTYKRKINASTSMKSRPGGATIPGVRITKLSLSGCNKPAKLNLKPKETSVKLYDPNNFISYNPDPFAATMTEDPFLASTMYYDERWILHQEMEFKKWLNALLTPPEHLSVDVDSVKVDIGKVWQSCRAKENVALAETKEAVSARYHTNTRLDTLRKAAFAMFTRPEMTSVLSQTAACVERGMLSVRQDRDLHRDIGLQKEILELFLSYNPLWLRIGLEVVYGETIPLNSNNDLVGLTKFLITRFFSDPFLVQTYSHPGNVSVKLPTFQPHLNKFIVKKFLLIVYFLDYAKKNKLIGHDPCLFHKKATYKESREILINFSRQTLSGVGDITKILRGCGYVVSQKQTFLDEYDYAVKDLGVDLRDGVRLCRVMELITGTKNLTCRCRAPAISRLQKVHNADLALTTLRNSGYTITGDIDAKVVADGHREKTLSLLWQIIYKFQAPRFTKSATTIQTWWRSKLWYIRTRNYLRNRKTNAAVVIQCAWRSFMARKIVRILAEKRLVEIKLKTKAARVLQTHWRLRMQMVEDREAFLKSRSAAITVQKWYRRCRNSRPFIEDLRRKRKAVNVIQLHWRAMRVMKIQRKKYSDLLHSVKYIQAWWRSVSCGKRDFKNFRMLKSATIFIQEKWRAKKSMEYARNSYLQKLRSSTIIQLWWRSCLAMKRDRNAFLIRKDAVRTISVWWIQRKSFQRQRENFLTIKKSVLIIQKMWRRYIETKNEISYLKKCQKSSLYIQAWWRSVRVRREYQRQRESAIHIQRWFRGVLLKHEAESSFKKMKRYAVLVQKTWRMKMARRKYLKIKYAALNIEKWYLNARKSRSIREEYLNKKNATIRIQRWLRSLKTTSGCHSRYLEIRKAVLIIQNQWRAKILAEKTRRDFLQTKNAIIKIQSYWRMILKRRSYLKLLKLQKHVIVVQRRFRAKKTGSVIRESFNKYKLACLIIQRKYRATIAARQARKNYLRVRIAIINIQCQWRMICERRKYLQLLERKKAAIVLQRRWRAKKIGSTIRKSYLNYRSAILLIQRKYQATLKARETRKNYLNLLQASIKLQRRWRERKRGHEDREKYLRVRKACICLQANWRMISAVKKYKKIRESIIFIQKTWRVLTISRRARNEYLNIKKWTIHLQNIFRAKKVGQLVRNDYLRFKTQVIFIQRKWRTKLIIREREEAASMIQCWWRSILLMKICQTNYEMQREAAIIIQQNYRAFRIASETRENYKKLRASVIKIQKIWRRLCEEKRRKEQARLEKKAISIIEHWWLSVLKHKKIRDSEKGKIKKLKDAAVIIQAAWRGYKIRKEQSAKLQELRLRSKMAAAAAEPTSTVEFRLREAINVLQNFSSVGQLLMCLACIETLTRLSIKGCIQFCENNLVEKIYHILEQSNRSRPWMDVCLRCTNILITLNKLPNTSHYTRDIYYMETIARLMNATVKRETELFLHLATLLWLLAGDPDFANEIMNSHGTIWLVKSVVSSVSKMKTNKTMSVEKSSLLPNSRPDWGLETNRPRTFTTIQHALSSLMLRLKITQGS